jgi:hypothetical protein
MGQLLCNDAAKGAPEHVGRPNTELARQLRDDVGDAAHPQWDGGHR